MPLVLRGEGEAQLGLAQVLVQVDTEVADQPAVRPQLDRVLEPAGPPRVSRGEVPDQLGGLGRRDRCAPALVAGDGRVGAVGGERGGVLGAEAAQVEPGVLSDMRESLP